MEFLFDAKKEFIVFTELGINSTYLSSIMIYKIESDLSLRFISSLEIKENKFMKFHIFNFVGYLKNGFVFYGLTDGFNECYLMSFYFDYITGELRELRENRRVIQVTNVLKMVKGNSELEWIGISFNGSFIRINYIF